jgi:HlyD family secretion protein
MDAELSRLRIDPTQRPRSRPPSRERRFALVLAGLALPAAAGYLVSANRKPFPLVEVVRVRAVPKTGQGADRTLLNATGYVIAAHEIEVASKVVGRVASIGVAASDRVVRGQELVRLEDSEYRARVVEAEGSLQSQRARLEALENGSRPEEIARAKADFSQANADLEIALKTRDRTRALVEQGLLARQLLDEAEAAYDAREAKVSAVDGSLRLVVLGPRREQIDEARAQVQQARGALAFAQEQLENTVIRAPIPGTILETNVEKGELVTTGFVGDKGAKGCVVSLADLGDLQVELDVSQNDISKLGTGDRALVTTDAYPDRRYEGTIEEISPEANRQKATIRVKVEILDPDERLRPEMNASVAFLCPENERAESPGPRVRVPVSAVRDGVIYLVVDGRAQRRAVVVAGTTSGISEIVNGLDGGEDVIVDPPKDLEDGDRVRTKESK